MPVVLAEPLDRTRLTGIGFDMFSDPLRRDAILTAMETGEPRATGRVLLGQQTGGDVAPGILLFSSLEPAAAVDGLPAGVLFAAFQAQELVNSALDKFPALPVHAEVFDGAVEATNLLFRSQADAAANMHFTTMRQLLVAGRPWTIEFRPTVDFTRPSSRAIPVMLGLFGLLLAVAIALLQRYQGRAFEAMSELRESSEKSLLEKDLMLQEMKHRIKNSITRVLAIARQTANGAKDVGEFSDSFAARLQAMAASQDMLTRSRWQKADLGELLHIELAQVFGKELPEGMLSGPRVMLSEAATQALGLTFHELATNALKYGEAGNSPDALKVGSGGFRRRRSAVAVMARDERRGGEATRNARLRHQADRHEHHEELKGTIRRDYRDDGLHIEIEIPLDGERGGKKERLFQRLTGTAFHFGRQQICRAGASSGSEPRRCGRCDHGNGTSHRGSPCRSASRMPRLPRRRRSRRPRRPSPARRSPRRPCRRARRHFRPSCSPRAPSWRPPQE